MNIKKDKGIVFVSGVIDESVDFNKTIGPVTPNTEFNCKGVTKINSNGVKAWISFFTQVSKTTPVVFSELSPVLVEQLNSLSNFCGKNKVASLMVPFACTMCKKETIVAMTIPELKANPEPNPIFCSHCNGRAEFDDLPEEYFVCLETLD